MKYFINTKIGYSSGVYGCTGEYFKLVIIEDTKHLVIHYVGMYGAEDRVVEPLRDAEYKEIWTGNMFGKLTGSDKRGFKSEHEALEEVHKYLKGQNE